MEKKINRPGVYRASDYAVLSAKNASFYYGYEHVYCKTCDRVMERSDICNHETTECCFVAKFDDEEIKIPFSKLGGRDEWECRENLLTGIGWILARYRLCLKKGG